MKKIALVLSLFLSFGLFAQNEVSTYFKNGNKKMELLKVGDRSMQTTYYESGEIKQMGTFFKNQPSGEWKRYNLNGEVVSEGFYKDDKLDNKTTYYEDGRIRDGKVTYLNENSQISEEVNYKEGSLVSKTQYKYYSNGQIKSEKNYKNDDGKVTYWHENGQIKSEGIFKDGVCIRGSC